MSQTNGENTCPNLTAFAHFHKRKNTKNHLPQAVEKHISFQ